MPEIEVKNVSHHFGRLRALHDVNLRIKDGEYVVLLGPSGCGKTTLLKNIAGIMTPTAGGIFIARKDVTKLPPEDRGLGFVFQNYALFPHLTVLDNARYGLLARGMLPEKAARIATDMLKIVHLENRLDAIPLELSGGMQQRLAVGRALSTGSKLILLDEPTNALDAYLRVELRNELRKMAKRLKLTTIHVTHDQEEAMAIADKIVVMKNGEIQQVGSPAEVYDHPANLFVSNFVGEANFLRVNFQNGKAKLLGKEVKAKLTGEHIAMIRPENLHFGKNGAEISLMGHQKLGPFYKYEADFEGTRLWVRSHNEWKNPSHIFFNSSHVLYFKEPEEGLEKALAAV
jgi:ABC-type Fe3+/spermidine/putrescine transport system ATPase subunit